MTATAHRPASSAPARRTIAPLPGLLLAAAAMLCACSTEPSGDEDVLPALSPRPDQRHCLAGVDIPADADTALVLPDTLSETGCFTDVATLAPAPDLVPYLVRAPLWTDGVYKQRYLALPPGQTIAFRETGAWELPVGAALIKLFILETRRGDPDTRRPLEARFMIRTGAGWHFASYAWDAGDGDDRGEAHLSSGRRTETFTVEDDGHTVEIRYYFPDRDGCQMCHDADTGVVLGPSTLQMNRSVRYADGRRNQLEALRAAGLLDGLPADLAALPAMVDPADEPAPLEARARSYLHGNCAHCHQPGGWTNPEIRMDLRYDVPFAASRTCSEPIHHVIYGYLGEVVIDPGQPDTSNLLQRMLATDAAAMPPTGQSLVDPAATEVVRAWIAGLRGCP
jgi:uncharacterized repeat protein (TIGR03806 family)